MFVTNLKSAAKCFRWYPRLLSADVVLHIMAFDFLWTIDSCCSGIFSWWKVLDERSRRHVQNASYALYFCTSISIVHLNYPSSYGCKYLHVIFSYLKCSTRSYIKIHGIGYCEYQNMFFFVSRHLLLGVCTAYLSRTSHYHWRTFPWHCHPNGECHWGGLWHWFQSSLQL